MSKSKNNELKFSIRNLIDTNAGENNSSQSTGVHHPPSHRSLKRLVNEPQQLPSIRRPIPILNPKIPHPCWSFLTQLTNKAVAANGTFPLNSSLIFLSKMSQVWEQIQQTQISPSIPTENDDASEEDTSSIHHDAEIEEEEEDEEEEDEDEDDAEAGECSSSGGDKLNPSSNSEENDKLKTYPCTHCGKVRSSRLNSNRRSIFVDFRSSQPSTISFDICQSILVFVHLSAK